MVSCYPQFTVSFTFIEKLVKQLGNNWKLCELDQWARMSSRSRKTKDTARRRRRPSLATTLDLFDLFVGTKWICVPVNEKGVKGIKILLHFTIQYMCVLFALHVWQMWVNMLSVSVHIWNQMLLLYNYLWLLISAHGKDCVATNRPSTDQSLTHGNSFVYCAWCRGG